MADHFDETGGPCTRHAPASPHGMLALALLGSRMPSFHHDIASKVQSLMMALDEIAELAAESPELLSATSTANIAVRDLQALISANRALQRPPQRKPTPLSELVAAAALRGGVKLTGQLPAHAVAVSLSAIAHAIAIVFDLAAGQNKLGRALEVTAAVEGMHVVVTVSGPGTEQPQAANANASDVLALASFALLREQGELRCGPHSFAIRLPLQQ